ncbi:DNA-binding protein, partial [uncultured Parabacteroides sp.]
MELVSFESLLDEIVEAGIPTNQVKGVIDRMNYLIRKHLSAGRRVQFGEFGNFRYGVGSIGSTTDEDFDPEMIKTPRIVFSPGSLLRKAKQDAKFERFAFVPVDSGNGSGGGEDDRPGEL